MENEGVAAYFPRAETCCNTSLHAENSRVGGDFPPHKPHKSRDISALCAFADRCKGTLDFVFRNVANVSIGVYDSTGMAVSRWMSYASKGVDA
jgi:hypothetical protein